MKSFLVYKFTCASCSSSCIGETCRHSKTRIEKHIKKDNKPHIFKHLHSTATCFDSHNYLYFKMIDKADSKLDLKLKEALHINWRKPNVNVQHCFLAFLFHLLFSLPLTLIIDIFYCLNDTFLFVHLIRKHVVSHLSFSSFVFIISALIVGIFYCLNYTSLFLHLFITNLLIDFIITM